MIFPLNPPFLRDFPWLLFYLWFSSPGPKPSTLRRHQAAHRATARWHFQRRPGRWHWNYHLERPADRRCFLKAEMVVERRSIDTLCMTYLISTYIYTHIIHIIYIYTYHIYIYMYHI